MTTATATCWASTTTPEPPDNGAASDWVAKHGTHVTGGNVHVYSVGPPAWRSAFLGTRGGSKKEEPKAAESAPAASGSVVSMLDDGFEAWAASPANMKKWEDSIAEMK